MAQLSTAALRRQKRQRQKERSQVSDKDGTTASLKQESTSLLRKKERLEVEQVPDNLLSIQQQPEFAAVIARFLPEETIEAEQEQGKGEEEEDHGNSDYQDETGDERERESDSFDEDDRPISKKQLKRISRMSLAELKQFARHPEVVEWEDVTAKDPKLLVQLKAVRHSVPVSQHWNQKRKYLSGKRGYVKPPFELPAFIRDTGITELRDAMRSQDANKRIKVKAREKMHPKLGRITVDYERLYDAFFKYQTKPTLTMHGELYYEGKEFQGGSGSGGKQDKRPGYLSEELRTALGMSTHLMPTPWLHNQQKYGAPPSYPHMRIPGLNAPIPEGAQWGYHPGGWGRPPFDHLLRDSSETAVKGDPVQIALLVPVERNLWGELEPEEELPSQDVGDDSTYGFEQQQEIVLDEDQVDKIFIPSGKEYKS